MSLAWNYTRTISSPYWCGTFTDPLVPIVTGPRRQPNPLSDPLTCPSAPGPTVGNPINLLTQRQEMTLACLQTPAAGAAIQVGLRYGAARVEALATGQAAGSRWVHSHDRRLYSWLAPSCASASCPLVQTQRVQMENGEAYDFTGTTAASGVTNYVTDSHVRSGKLAFDATTQQYTLTYPRGQTDVFNVDGELIRTNNRDGSYLEFVRTRSGTNITQLDIVSYPTGRTTRLSYADVGGGAWRLTEVRDQNPPSGTPLRLTTLAYTNGNLTRYTNAAGRVQQFRYDTAGRMVAVYDAENNPDVLGAAAKATLVTYTSPSADTVAAEVSISGTTLALAKVTGQPWDLVVTETSIDAQVRTLRFKRDEFQRITRTYLPNSTTVFEETVYDNVSGGVAATYDVGRRVTQYCYGTAGNVNRVRAYKAANAPLVPCGTDTGAAADETKMFNNAFGEPEVIIEPSGTVKKFTYAGPGGAVDTIYLWDGVSIGQWTQIAYAPVALTNGAMALADLPTAVILPDGTVHRQAYDTLGLPTVTTLDANGLALTTRTQYDARGYLLAATDARGVVTEYAYAQNPALGQYGDLGLPSSLVIDSGGKALRSDFTYNALGLLTQQVDDVGGRNVTTTSTYVPVGSEGGYAPRTQTDAQGGVTEYVYTGLGELDRLIQKAVLAGGGDRTTRFTYTAEGWPDTVVLHDGRVAIDRSYFPDGLLQSVRDARGATNAFAYDGKGRLLTQTTGTTAVGANPAINGVVTYAYDGADRLFEVRRHDNSIAYQASYDGLGRLQSEQDGAGHRTLYAYDNARNYLLTRTLGADVPSEQIVHSYTYDRLGRVNRQRSDPDGLNLITDYRYTDAGSTDRVSLQQVIDANGGVTRYRYDSLGQLDRLIDALGNTTRYTYDKRGSLTRITPPRGAPTDYVSDALGRVTQLSRDGKNERWAYFPDSLLRQHSDFSGQLIDYQYDATGRLSSIDYAGTVDDPNGARSDASFAYDLNDLLLGVTSAPDGITAETTAYAYDAANRMVNRSRSGRTVGYGYDADNRLTTLHYWLRMAVDYGYGTSNSNGQIQSLGLRDGAGVSATSSYSYRASGQLKQISRPTSSALTSALNFDTAGRLLGIDHQRAGVTVQGVRYQLDRNGNRSSLTEALNAGGGVANYTTQYGYDALDRLISVDAAALGSAPRKIETYLYDAMGNREAILTSQPGAASINTGDLDGDGDSDYYYREHNASTTAGFIMGGNAGLNFTVQSAPAGDSVESSDWIPTVMADFGGSGKPSVLWRHRLTGQNRLALLGGENGIRTVATATVHTVADLQWQPEAAADFNEDGVPDILWRNQTTGAMVVWTMGGIDGAEHLSTGDIWLQPEPDTAWRVRASGDFNRDGKPDLVWRNQACGDNRVWIMGGANNATRQGTVALFKIDDPKWDIIGTADQDGDGTVDLLWQNQWGAMNLWYMSPSSSYPNSEVMREWQTLVNPYGSAGVGP